MSQARPRPTPGPQVHIVKARIPDSWHAALVDVADYHGVSQAAIVRMALRPLLKERLNAAA